MHSIWSAWLLSSNVQFQTHGAVVGAEDVGIDGCSRDFVFEPVGNEEIVDAPAGILLPGLEHIAPPGITANSIGI